MYRLIQEIQITQHRAGLLKKFYSSIDKTTVKLECTAFGFDILDMFQKDGTIIEYCELKNNIGKYKLSNLTDTRFNNILRGHVAKAWNICGYFNSEKNNIFAFNFDDRSGLKEQSEEIGVLLVAMYKYLTEIFHFKPLIIESGKGFHVWLKLSEAVENMQIQWFMYLLTQRVRAVAKENNSTLFYDDVDIIGYPVKDTSTNSLRLPFSKHVRTGEFSHVITPKGILSEEKSWNYFEQYIKNKSITPEQLLNATCALNYIQNGE